MHIWELFPGYEHAHGRYEVRSTDERGKAQGKALTIREPVKQEDWDRHLDGDGPGLGVIPLRSDNTVGWACIDIDVIGINHAELEEKIKKLGLPLVVARSKSGGAHCFLFCNEYIPAGLAQRALESWAAALGHGGCEVFPKQVDRYNEQDIGNWLNMPYYHAERTLRYGFRDGKPLRLEAFVEYAVSRRVGAAEIDAVHVAPVRDKAPPVDAESKLFTDGPPCLQIIERMGGFPEGTRNDGMYNVAVYLRKRYADDWEDRIQGYNVAMCDPPLSLAEINTIVKSVGRKSYGYRCKQQPIKPHCHRRLCMAQPFGVGESAEGRGRPEIGHIVKHEGNPVIYFVDIDGQRLMMTIDDLLVQTAFKRKVAQAINRVPTTIPQARWDIYIDEKLRNCDVVEVPEDASPEGQFKLLVEQYLTGMAQATSRDELAQRFNPYDDGHGHVLFRSRGLLDYLSNHGFKYQSEHHVWQMLREMGAENEFINVKGKGFNVWKLPKPNTPEGDAPLPSFGTKEF